MRFLNGDELDLIKIVFQEEGNDEDMAGTDRRSFLGSLLDDGFRHKLT